MPPEPPRRNNIDALRLILALLVLLSHSYPLATGHEADEPLARLTGGQVTLGEVAVAGFFVLSGLLIAPSWERSPTAWAFVRRRVGRIYPGYLAAVAVGLLVVVPLATPGLGAGQLARLAAAEAGPILALRGFTPPAETFRFNPKPGVVNGSLWSIPYEAWCYVGVMVLGATTLLRRRWAVLGLLVAAIGVSVAFGVLGLTPGGRLLGRIFGYPPFWARLLPYYLAGVVAHLFRDAIRPDRRLALASLAGLALAAVIPGGVRVALPILGTYLLIYLAYTPALRWHGAARDGDFSYGIYLYGFPIQQLIVLRLGPGLDPLALFALALVPTVLAGVLSWHLVERHFLRRARVRATEDPDNPSPPPPPRRRARFTLRAALLAVPVLAVAIVLAAGINPVRRDPIRQAVDASIAWCQIPTDSFDATENVDWSTKPPTFTPDKPAVAAGPCLLKVAEVGFVEWDRKSSWAFGTRTKFSLDGRSELSRITPMAIQGGGGSETPAELAAIRRLLPALPPSQPDIPPGPYMPGVWGDSPDSPSRTESHVVVLGFHDGKSWVTRTYNLRKLPPAVADLLGLLGLP